jgi:coenzyme F420-reducing hydrogenase beta subunit
MRLDDEGFYRPDVDQKKCIQCGMCERICPWNHEVMNPNNAAVKPKTVAAYAKDNLIRLQSSSGGVFSILANKILDDGGVVVGVAQEDKSLFSHVVVRKLDDLKKIRGSKYVQANVGMIYKEVQFLLKSGCKCLFSGTPCQIAALYTILGPKAETSNLFTVDIVCHGTPSVKVFEKYISEIESKESAIVKSSCFRDKRKGWRMFSMTSSLKYPSGNRSQISKTRASDAFMRIFLKNICLNTSCADCHYAKLPRIADISLGDYWNIADVHPQMDDDKGTSVVLLNTAHGEHLFESVLENLCYCESSIERAIDGNPCIVSSSKQHPNRADFFDDLEYYKIEKLIKKYCPYNHFKIRNLVKKILGYKLYAILKRLCRL